MILDHPVHCGSPWLWNPVSHSCKSQLISKTNCQAEDSFEKRMNEFVFTSMRRVFVRFLEESSARKKTFRDYLTFRHQMCFDRQRQRIAKMRYVGQMMPYSQSHYIEVAR